MPTTKLIVDGHPHEAPLGGRLIDFLFTLGKDVPHFCYHPALSVVASCRQCQVESKGKGSKPGLLVACREKIVEGMEILTDSPAVQQARAGVMEFLLINHPLDCPICDKAGECRLQDTAFQTGQAQSRYQEPRRELEKRKDLGDVILLDQERCILCTRCVRFFEDVEGKSQICVDDRGDRSVVTTFDDRPLTGNYQGNLADICPVGALTLKKFRFKSRVWDLDKVETLCGLCSRGCNTIVETKRGKVVRIRPRVNADVNGWWICDQGRLQYDDFNWTDNDGRLLTGFVAHDGVLAPADTDAAFAQAARLLSDAGTSVVAVLSPFATCEEGEEFKRLFARVPAGGTGLVGFFAPSLDARLADAVLHTDDPCPNRRGLEAAGLQPLTAAQIADAARSARAVFLSGERLTLMFPDDVKATINDADALVLHTRRFENLTNAKVALPCLSYLEKSGHWVNVAGRRQALTPALTPPGRLLPDRDVLRRLGTEIQRAESRQPAAAAPGGTRP